MDFVPVVKPVGGKCNLLCSYCYFKQKEGGIEIAKRMNTKILQSLIKLVCNNSQSTVEFIWHGGEPLLAGRDFYRQVVELQSKYANKGQKVYNSVQTNGLLIDWEWIDFFQNNNFSVGLSLDGPQYLHDQTRHHKERKGSFSQVLKALKLTQEAKILSNVICCVSSINRQYPEEIFDFFISEGIKHFKLLQVQGRDKTGQLLPYSVNGEHYADFLIKIFDKWIEKDDPEIEIREIKSIVNLLLGGEYRECIFAGECYKYFTVYPDGMIYGCDSLPKVETLCFGHVSGGIEMIKQSSQYQRFRQRTEELQKKCIPCEWYQLCRGGCLQDWWPDIFNPATQNLFCRGFKKIFSHIHERLQAYDML